MAAEMAPPTTAHNPETAEVSALKPATKESRSFRRPHLQFSEHASAYLSRGGYAVCKRAFEWLLALFGSLLALPILTVCGVLIRLTSRGPAFYSQTRLGKDGTPFRIYKLRTMYHDCEKLSGAQWSRPGDPRVTPVGYFLRRLHLDELPQLWNVLRGDMALVGPRPERPEFLPSLEQAIPLYCDRLLVKPGVTGLAQVQLPPDTDLHSVRRKLAYDLYYIARVGFWLDLRLILCTMVHLAGVPYRHVTWLFGMPSAEVIEEAYRKRLKN